MIDADKRPNSLQRSDKLAMVTLPAMLKDRRTLHHEIADVVSERIISGEFSARSLLPPERQLCETLGVSRTVIREAIKVLESQGLVRIERGRGTVVLEAHSGPLAKSLSLLLRRRGDTIQNLLEVRKILEVGIAGLAAQRRTEIQLQTMARAIDTMRQNPGKPEGYVEADIAFHSEIARASQNPLVLLLLDPFTELLRESRVKTFAGPGMVRLRARQHEEIYESILAQDVEAAQEAMRRHLSDTEKDLAHQHPSGATLNRM